MNSQDSSDSSVQPTASSMLDRLILRSYRSRAIIPLGIALFLLPIVLAYADGLWDRFVTTDLWRVLLIQPAVILYILLMWPVMHRARQATITSLRPIVQVTDQEFDRLVSEESRVEPRGELMAILIGALVGWFLKRGMAISLDAPWLQAYQTWFTVAMYAALAWVIHSAVAGTRLVRGLLRQPLQVDILDIRPFEPVGRESMLVSLAFIIGTTLAMVFSATRQFVLTVESILIYCFFALVTVLVFFLNMRDTHSVLADTKMRELDLVKEHISQAYQILKLRAQDGRDTQAVVAELGAWVACEERLNQARTWPYNTEIIGQLLISTLIPIGVERLVALVQRWSS